MEKTSVLIFKKIFSKCVFNDESFPSKLIRKNGSCDALQPSMSEYQDTYWFFIYLFELP